jgi:glycosyltransferase involved in cell wall biosynthesis
VDRGEPRGRMRIALISNLLPGPGRGGAERYAGALAGGLAQRGHEVTLYSGEAGAIPGADCRSLPGMPPLDPAASAVRKAAWHAREQWLPAVHRALLSELRARRPDVVHSHEPQLLSAAVFTAIAAAGLPHVHTAHDFNLLCARTTMTRGGQPCGGRCADCRVQRAIRGRAIRRRLDLLLAPSDFVRERHIAYDVVAPDRAVTLRHGAEPGRRRVRRPPAGRLRVGFLGTLAEHKGLRTLLRAAERMPAGWDLTIAGSGPLAAEIRAAASRDLRIAFAGELDAGARDAFLDGLDVLAIPSEWEEPATLVAVEAAVRGLPAVVSDRGGLPETPHACVFPARDADALLSTLGALSRDPDELARRSQALLDSSPDFEWSTHLEAVERALERVARER